MEIGAADRSETKGQAGQTSASHGSALEHAALWIERPVRRIAGSNRLNPLPHAGTITVFLLGVVVVSGLYITLFFEFGHVASYEAVAKMEEHAIQKVVRALHRYSSAALVVTTLVHAWRIFAAGRFRGGPRPWRWATGVAALVLVWLAGVTGYWLVWDVRAQAINEATLRLLREIGFGQEFALRELSGVVPGSGSGFLLVLWFAHVLLTIVIVWFAWRHLRRSRLPWFPPRIWMALMGGALIMASLAVPVGMLGPARADLLPSDMPLDPFVMFLLPPLLSDFSWLIVVGSTVLLVVVLALPRLLRGPPTPVVSILAQDCTGCDLCVVDCPYDALSMVSRGEHEPSLAVLDSSRCVGCGICLGSCSFGAISLPDFSTRALPPVAGKHVIIACDRHLEHSHLATAEAGQADTERVVSGVRCAGAFDPSAVRHLTEQGALDVQLVGCPPGDCVYGVGNQLASERMTGERAPHPPRKFYGNIVQDWISPLDFASAIEEPGQHAESSTTTRPEGRNKLIGAGLLVTLSVVGIVAATRAPFRSEATAAEIRIGLDHTEGRGLLIAPDMSVGAIDALEVRRNSELVGRQSVTSTDGRSLGLFDWEIPPGPAALQVTAHSGDRSSVVYNSQVDLDPGRRQIIVLTDVPAPPGAEEGREVFTAREIGCQVCHSVEAGDDGVGPSLYGVASRADGLVEGLSAELYLRQSILLPDQYIVEGWPSGQMLPIYLDRLSEQELNALVTYLLTLTEEER
ncbi:MAG: cytochrome b N-terminal domain-containing protein [Acidimicrobiales bacterium]